MAFNKIIMAPITSPPNPCVGHIFTPRVAYLNKYFKNKRIPMLNCCSTPQGRHGVQLPHNWSGTPRELNIEYPAFVQYQNKKNITSMLVIFLPTLCPLSFSPVAPTARVSFELVWAQLLNNTTYMSYVPINRRIERVECERKTVASFECALFKFLFLIMAYQSMNKCRYGTK